MTATTIDRHESLAEPADGAPPDRHRGRRLSVVGLLLATALLYLWDLGASGYANEFYAAAVQAGTKSWKAFFFGSLDSANSITVDKPPLSLWPMEIAGRIFGFNSWSMLVPQAIEGVLAVWLLYATVKRWFGHSAGLIAGSLLAITPVAVLMFRFNNPDAMMVLLIVLAAYCVTRAIEAASTTWVLLAGAVMGLSFLAKGLQPFTVLPALAIAYLVCAPTSLRRRLLQLLGAAVAIVVAAGWWVLAVDLTPAADRPYIGGSGNNTALGLAFGYNGFSRISGSSGGPGGGGGASFSGATGLGRLFNSLDGGQISWLLPAALVSLVAVAVLGGRLRRTDRRLAALIVWGGWLLITGLLLSFASGTVHTYYTVELAPAIAALVGIGVVTMWRSRQLVLARVALAVVLAGTGIWSWVLLDRATGWFPWVKWLVLVATVVAAAGVLVTGTRRGRLATATVALAAVVSLGGGSAAYALQTASTPHTGSTPSAGPTTSSSFGAFGGGTVGGGTGGPPSGGTTGGFPSGGFPGSSSGSSSTGSMPSMPSGSAPSGSMPSGSMPSMPSGSRSGSTMSGSPGGSTTVSSALVTLLENTSTTWSAATVGSQTAAPLELESNTAVMAIGGFTGSDNSPTLAQFKAYVKAGEIRYFIAGGGAGGGGAMGGSGSASAITTWVENHFASKTVGGTTVYDLTNATSS